MKGNFFYKRLGFQIAKERKIKSLSQEKLALVSSVDRTYIARIEEGRANPSVKVLNKLCKGLGMRLSELLKGV